MSLLGIDIGSSRCKGLAFDNHGKIIARAEAPYEPCCPAAGRAEMDAEVFWEAVVRVIRGVSAAAANDPVEGLAIASHGETFIPADCHGQAVSPAIMNSDNRAIEQADAWSGTLGRGRIYAITGLPLHPMFALNKILWLRDNQPETYNRATYFVGPADYVLMKMGFPPVTDYSLASRYMAFDIGRKRWSEEILSAAGIGADRLPQPLPAGQAIGKLPAEAADILGLRAGITVSLGGHDQPCGSLGAGNLEPGQVSDSAGTYECLAVPSLHPLNSPKALACSLNSYCHVVPDRYITLAFFPSGIMVRWFVEQLCGIEALEAAAGGRSVYDVVAEKVEAERPVPTGLIVTPHLIGSCNPNWDVRATGVIAGLTPGVTRVQLYKAVFEGIACEMAQNAGVLQELSGPFDSIRIFGGNARSPFSVQLRADICGKRMVSLAHSDMVCHGAAMLAGIGAGVYRDFAEAAGSASPPHFVYGPRAGAASEYKEQIQKYAELFSSLRGFRALEG